MSANRLYDESEDQRVMKVKSIIGGICAPKGFVAGGIHCGIRKNRDKLDLAIIKSDVRCHAAAMYTQNKVYGAPIQVTRENISDGWAQAVVVNSGNANTCNRDGVEKARIMCELTGNALGIPAEDVIVASTGVIGQELPIEPIESGITELAPYINSQGGTDAALAIMTTDTQVKELAVECTLSGVNAKIGAIAKGSGMIHPNMATMLSFITTDASISHEMLAKALKRVVADSFNMISVDGDTSTNDMVSIMANGMAGNPEIVSEGEDYETFVNALMTIAVYMSRLIAGDGEGATKLLECQVEGAPDELTAKKVAKSIITSSLFKAAMFGADANWGRILCAIGYTDAEFDIYKIDVSLASGKGCIHVCNQGYGIPFDEDEAKLVLSEDEIRILVDMNQGPGCATAWGCDLTYDYVKINGDYRT